MCGLLDRMQPWVIGHFLAGFQIVMQPANNRFIDQMAVFKQITVNLLTHLNGIATIDKHGSLIAKDHRRPGRAGKAGQPRQTFSACRDIFALMFIGARHNKTINTLGGQIGAQGRNAFCRIKIVLCFLKQPFAFITQGQQRRGKFITWRGRNQVNPVGTRITIGCGKHTINQVNDSANILTDLVAFKQGCKLGIAGNRHEHPLSVRGADTLCKGCYRPRASIKDFAHILYHLPATYTLTCVRGMNALQASQYKLAKD